VPSLCQAGSLLKKTPEVNWWLMVLKGKLVNKKKISWFWA